MALKPGKYTSRYNISDTILDRVVQDGTETFRGSGSDYSEIGSEVIYIANVPLKRVVVLKAFIESANYSISKSTEITEEKDKNSKVFTTLDGDMEIDVVINIPAHSTNEARNNLAKIEELQRLISPNSGYKYENFDGNEAVSNVDVGLGIIPPVFRVWFKNIISSGKSYKSYSTPLIMKFNDIMNFGFPCIIDSISFEPDMEAGFLKLDNFLYPKVIKLSLKLIMETSQVRINELPIEGFEPTGDYTLYDNKFFPFCVSEFQTNRQINSLDYSLDQGTQDNAFFMSLETSTATRWVAFKPFLESFTRTYGTNVTYAESKERVGKLIASDQSITFKDLSYKFKLLVPAKDITEAKRNCAKIQYLMRMFYRPPKPIDVDEIGLLHDFAGDNVTSGKKEYVSLSNRRIRVYSPSFIEKAGAARGHGNLTFDFMFQNGISMFLQNLAVEINFEMGFFEEDGKLYPKELAIDLDFIYDSNDLIKTYTLVEGDIYKMQSTTAEAGPAHLFPYNRKTVKLG